MKNKNYLRKLKQNGVIMNGDGLVNIDEQVEIASGVTIEDNVYILGNSKIEKGAYIGSGTYIENSYIGCNAKVLNSRITNAYIGHSTTVGPYANIHTGSEIAEMCRVGNFVEIKNSHIGALTKMAHLAYIGDADIGANCNIGCGAIFVNYDGTKKSRSTIGNSVFIGSNSNIIAPVTIHDGAYIAAGSTVTIDLQENDLCIARAREVVKPNRSKYTAK